MNVLLIGSGGREHAIAWKLRQSKQLEELYCAPGNAGIAQLATCVPINATDIDAVVAFAKKQAIDLVIVAPDDPLATGMVDALQKEGIRAFGPTQSAARIESSKVFAKELMQKYNIPTAKYAVFTNPEEALNYVEIAEYPLVVKADGLALGKGVLICQTKEEAREAIQKCMIEKVFGDSGSRIIVEEFIEGPEVSILAFADGKTIRPMISAQDHKRIFDHDEGPNTGGMGTFAPSQRMTDELMETIRQEIMEPTMEAMRKEGCLFSGVLYFGLMLTQDGIKVLEYNARFGDPETQVILPLLDSDLLEIMNAVVERRLSEQEIAWKEGAAVCVVLASEGYPSAYKKGDPITGLDQLPADTIVFHAGTKKENDGFVTNGGRVVGITACGKTLEEAREKAYASVDKVSFDGMQFRTDISQNR